MSPSPNPFNPRVSPADTIRTPSPEIPSPHSPLDYASVPPLNRVVYRQGRAAFRMNPYSKAHAYLTGHGASPSLREGLVPDRSWKYDPNVNERLSEGGEPEKGGAASSGVTGAYWPRLLPALGDIPEPATAVTMPEEGGRRSPRQAVKVETTQHESNIFFGIQGDDDGPDDDEFSVRGSSETESEESISIANDSPVAEFPDDERHQSAIVEQPAEVPHHAEPVERGHRRMAPRYSLRNHNRGELSKKITAQAKASVLPFDNFFLRQASVKRFNPAFPVPSTVDLLYDCASITGRGITIPQFGKVFRQCMTCSHYVLARPVKIAHDCKAKAVDVNSDMFSFTEYLCSERCLGLTMSDFEDILTVCDTCLRVHLVKHADWHRCPPEDDRDFAGK